MNDSTHPKVPVSAVGKELLRVWHVTEYCHLGSVGGTERYILDLLHELEPLGVESSICWLRGGPPLTQTDNNGIRIAGLPAPSMRVDSPLREFQSAAIRFLDQEKPSLLHFHTFGLTEALLAKLGKARGIPYIFTYHSPAWTCRRETLLLWGLNPCDGEVRPWRCSTCLSQTRMGGARWAGRLASAFSLMVGWMAKPLGKTSLRRRLAFYHDTARLRRVLRRFLSECDLAVSCCDWSRPVLLANGAVPERTANCAQGVSNDFVEASCPSSPKPTLLATDPFIVGFVGRLSSVKGVHILLEGFRRTRDQNVRLKINGVGSGQYVAWIQEMVAADPRVELISKKPMDEMVAEYQRFSLLAVPSDWMESGPLTLMEALTLGIPVYGSTRIGQRQLLLERGRMVVPNTPEAWRDALEEAFEKHRQGLWKDEVKRAWGNHQIRTMGDVATEMKSHYVQLTGKVNR